MLSSPREHWRRIRRAWNRTDTLVLLTNLAAFAAFVGNAWWGSVAVCHAASAIPLATQTAWAARREGPLRDALVFGVLMGLLWPVGEGVVGATLGWWGGYRAAGLFIWDTPSYCILIGALASTYLAYLGTRIEQAGYARRVASFHTGLSAVVVGFIGEALFLAAGMWQYEPSWQEVWGVPLFVPIGYGVAYAAWPRLRPLGPVRATLVFAPWALAVLAGLGLVTGFYPR